MDSTLDQRVSALQALGVVSTLMSRLALSDGGSLEGIEQMLQHGWAEWYTFDGVVFQISFFMMSMIAFANLMATYVSVAQSYHTYRLVSTGAVGFEMAKSYYLNPNICNFRHFAIKAMMVSVPALCMACVLRHLVAFDDEAADASHEKQSLVTFMHLSASGCFWGVAYCLVGLAMLWLHRKHDLIFKDRYEVIQKQVAPVVSYSRSLGKVSDYAHPLDV